MRIDISFKYLEKSEFIDKVLENNFKKLERRLKLFRRTDPIHISVHIEKNPHKEQYFCRSHIYLPSSKFLSAEEKSSNCALAINKSFSAMVRQIDKVKHIIERHLSKRVKRVQQVQEDSF